MITVTQSISGTLFSSAIPDVIFTISGVKSGVTMTVDGEEIFNEVLYPLAGTVTLADLPSLVTAYARQKLKVTLAITINEMDDADSITSTTSMTASVIYCTANIISAQESINAETFCNAHFLSLLLGNKTTSLGRLEFLHYLGTEAASVLARYSDGTMATFTPPAVKGSDVYTTIDVSPNRFVSEGKTLISFTATAGSRSQTFVIDLDNPDCAPVLLFVNSFGVEELVVLHGKTQGGSILHAVDGLHRAIQAQLQDRGAAQVLGRHGLSRRGGAELGRRALPLGLCEGRQLQGRPAGHREGDNNHRL